MTASRRKRLSGLHSVIFTNPSWTSCVVLAMAFVLTLIPGQHVSVPPLVDFRGCATQLDVHPAFHPVRHGRLVGIARSYVAFDVVGIIAQPRGRRFV